MIFATPRGELSFTFQGSTLGRGHRGGGHRGGGRRGGFYSVSYPSSAEYVAPVVVVATPACSTFPNPPPPCTGTLVWQGEKTVCCR